MLYAFWDVLCLYYKYILKCLFHTNAKGDTVNEIVYNALDLPC